MRLVESVPKPSHMLSIVEADNRWKLLWAAMERGVTQHGGGRYISINYFPGRYSTISGGDSSHKPRHQNGIAGDEWSAMGKRGKVL